MSVDHVVVAMSGGVDSSVAALLLCESGVAVTGVTMDIWCPTGESGGVRATGCCGAESARDAAEVCRQLGCEHHVVSFRSMFEEAVIGPFVKAYASGQTPNPCIECNRAVKWGALLGWAERVGADTLATGHYARIEERPQGPVLLRGADRAKDQSYALYMLSPEELRRTRFPCGAHTKAEVRKLAADAGLPVAERPESQEIRFIPDDDHLRWVRERRPDAARPGPILDRDGNVLGEHRGLAAYTIGQRKGLGLSGGPWYVVGLDAESNTLTVGPDSATYASEILVEDVHLGAACEGGRFEASVMCRYRGPERAATIALFPEERAHVRFHEPQRAPAPGQAAVFYRADVVLGGERSVRSCVGSPLCTGAVAEFGDMILIPPSARYTTHSAPAFGRFA